MEQLWPFLKPFLQSFGVCLLFIAVIYALITCYNKEEGSANDRFVKVIALTELMDSGQVTTEERHEYHKLVTSFWGQGFFSGIDPDNYEEIRKRARYWAEKLFY